MKPYDDDEYQDWHNQFTHLVRDFLDTEGNTPESLRKELNELITNIEAGE